MYKGKKTLILLVILLVILSGGYVFLNRTTKVNSTDFSGYTVLRDDSLAAKYAPKFVSYDKNELPYKMYYRAAKDGEGNIFIAYHPVWTGEINKSKGFLPFLNRILYTGGLKLQRMMYGKEDVEAVLYKIDSFGKIVEIEYEMAENYNPKSFSVSHKKIKFGGSFETPGYLKVTSWNHLFEYYPGNPNTLEYKVSELMPEYFTEKEWVSYGMFKEKESFLKRSRAYYIFEIKSAE